MASCKKDKNKRRRDIWKKTNGVCAHCGKAASAINQTIDHFIPRSWGGTFDKRNLMPLCADCNRERKNESIDPARFYSYAPKWAVADCKRYKKQFERSCNSYLLAGMTG